MTSTTLKRSSGYKGAAVAFVGALLTALMLGTVLWVGPTGAQTCPPGEDCEPPNFPPTVEADRADVLAVEGQTATNTGTYADRFDDGDVAIEASVGEVTKTGTSSGTWSWSLADVPFGEQYVTITATDSRGESSTTGFFLTVTFPNGKIAFTSVRDGNSQIYAMNADGSGQTNLTNDPAWDFEPAFSPDGTRIAFVSARDGDYDIYAMNANGTGQTRLTDDPAWDLEPAFSPGGSRITFRSERDGNWEIYVMNADGSEQTRLTNHPASDSAPAFSPHGSKIAFVSTRNGLNSEIYAMNADGSEQTNLTNDPAWDFDPVFSPDGTRIAFGSERDGDYDIYVMNADGTGQTRLTNDPASDYGPAFSPDGSKIAFSSNRDGDEEIYVMNSDGSEQTRLTNNAALRDGPSWGGASDTAPPETSITSAPVSLTNSRQASFAFSSSEASSAFECSLDGGPFERCASPKGYSDLAEGQHAFEVRATDVSGNADASPASHTWTVDLTAPEAPAITNPDDGSYNNTGDFAVSGTAEPGAKVELFKGAAKIGEDAADASGGWGVQLTGVPEGSHAYSARATDEAGNASTPSEERTVIVDKTGPTIANVSPADGALKVSGLTNVTATFSERMDPVTLDTSTVTLKNTKTGQPVTDVAVTATDNPEGKTVVTLDPFPSNPATNLAKKTRYEVRITTGARDPAGNSLAADRVWSFTTGNK